MSVRWTKAFRDFWRERTRTFLVVAAIATGIAAFSTVMSTYAVLVRELDRGYLESNPASATLRIDKVDEELRRAVLSDPEVSDAEPRRALHARIKTGPMEWRPLVLFAVQDYGSIRLGKLKPQAGKWPPAAGEMLIERDAFGVAHAHIGDTVRVKTASGGERALRVTGSVHDVGQAQARMENIVYGYIVAATLPRLGEEPRFDQLKILVATNRFDERHVRGVTARIQRLIEARGHTVLGVEIPRPGKHPHADLMGMLLLAMSTFGLLALVLSGIIVVNMLTALMASQVRQIGVMKALGGTDRQIAALYFAQALLLGLAAIAVAVPAGMWGSRLFCRAMAVFLNFDIASFSVPAWVYLLDVAVGIVAPLLAAAWPIVKGSRVSIREALADFGVAESGFGATAFDRALARIGGRARPVLIAIRNGFRRRTRVALTMTTLTAAGLFFMSALNVRQSMIHTLDRMFDARRYDLQVVLGAAAPRDVIERAVRNTPGIRRAEAWMATAVPDRFTMLAIPPRTEMIAPPVVAGRALQPGDVDAMVVNTAAAEKWPQLRPGNAVAVRTESGLVTWHVVGVVRELFSPAVAYVPLRGSESNSLRVILEKNDRDSINRVTTMLEQNLEREGVRSAQSLSKADSRVSFDQHMLMIYVFLVVVAGILAIVGGLGLATSMSLNVLERRREMGVLRAIGATPGMVWLLVVAEAGVISLASWLVATVLAWPVSRGIGAFLSSALFRSGLDFSFAGRGTLIWLGVSIVLSVAASFVPAWHASRVHVREALAYE